MYNIRVSITHVRRISDICKTHVEHMPHLGKKVTRMERIQMYLYKKKRFIKEKTGKATAILQDILTLIITLIIRCIEIVLLLLIYICFKIMF